MVIGAYGRQVMKQYVTIDIGGTNIKYGIVSQSGEILSCHETDTPVACSGATLLTKITSIVEEMNDEKNSGIGIATLGAVSPDKGMVIGMCDNLPVLAGLPIKEHLTEKFKLPVSIMNDVNATALGEAGFGAGKGLKSFYCITLGTGIGGAYVYDGRVVEGAHGVAGEIGYLWDDTGENYESLASAKRFSEESKLIGNHEDKMLEPALRGDSRYAELLEKWSMNVARGIADMVYLLDPGTVIIGGAVSDLGTLLTDKISLQLNKIIRSDYKGKTTIIPAMNGNASNMLGAIYPFLK